MKNEYANIRRWVWSKLKSFPMHYQGSMAVKRWRACRIGWCTNKFYASSSLHSKYRYSMLIMNFICLILMTYLLINLLPSYLPWCSTQLDGATVVDWMSRLWQPRWDNQMQGVVYYSVVTEHQCYKEAQSDDSLAVWITAYQIYHVL